jgi:hypothetical protein
MHSRIATYGAMALVIGIAAAAGCSDDADGDDTGGSGGTGGMPTTTSMNTGAGPTTGTAGMGGGNGDGNDSFGEAVTLTLGMATAITQLDPVATDEDFYKFTGQEGDVIFAIADAKPSTDEFDDTYVDVVLTMYDQNMNKVAENDDPYLSRDSNDSELWTMLPSSGTFYIRVTECNAWESGGAANCSDAAMITHKDYRFTAFLLDDAEDGNVGDTEGGDDKATNPNIIEESDYVPNTTGVYFATVQFGTFNDNSDVDVYRVILPADINHDSVLYGAFFINGPEGIENGTGSSANIGLAWIENDAGERIAEIDHSAGMEVVSRDIRAPMVAGDTYWLYVQHPGGAAGSRDFYLFNHNGTDSNELEANEVLNNTASTADPLTTMANGELQSTFVGGDLLDGDTDHFIVQKPSGFTGTLSVACGAWRQGSGVRGFSVDVLDETGLTTISSSPPEDETEDLLLDEVDVDGEDAVIVKFTANPLGSTTVTSRFYQCGIHFVPPAPP